MILSQRNKYIDNIYPVIKNVYVKDEIVTHNLRYLISFDYEKVYKSIRFFSFIYFETKD